MTEDCTEVIDTKKEAINKMGGSELNLAELPTEILIHICHFLDAAFVRNVLSRVNRRLAQLVCDPIIWKLRISARWPSRYPPVSPEEPPWEWARACASREKFSNSWSKHETLKEKVKVRGHYSSVDTVLLLEHGLLVTGSRDRSLALWNVHHMEEEVGSKGGLIQKWADVHKGWVWSLCADARPNEPTVVSCGWDNKVHIWKLTNTEMILENSINCTTALLCSDIHSASRTVVLGTFDKKVKMFDMRLAKPTVMSVKHHRMPVLSVSALPNSSHNVISASEDGTLAMMDRRNRKVVSRLHFPNGSYPMCMKLMDEGVNCLVVGDKIGGLHLIDANKMEEIKEIKNLHSNKITGIDVSLSGIVTTSSDKTVKILQPDMSLNVITTLQVADIGDVVSVSMDDDCLAAGSSSEVVQVWRPKIDNNSNEIQVEQDN